MLRTVILAAVSAVLGSVPASAAILYQQTVTADNGTAFISDTVTDGLLARTGSYWIGVEGGTIDALDYQVDANLTKLWWEDIGPDEDGQPVPNLTGNNYSFGNGCSVSVSAPSCTAGPTFRSRLGNNIVRIDFRQRRSFSNCQPFDGVFNVDCAEFYDYLGPSFQLTASGLGDVTLTIYDTPLAGAVPEPGTWALMIAGFGLTGTAVRRRRSAAA